MMTKFRPTHQHLKAAPADIKVATRVRGQWSACAYFTFLGLTAVAAGSAHASEVEATGKVAKVFAMDTSAYGDSSILVAGLVSAGTCPKNDGLVALILRDDNGGKRQLAVALAAKIADLPVVVRVDDGHKNAKGHCYLAYLELN